jgi:hypothetical protein
LFTITFVASRTAHPSTPLFTVPQMV